MNGQNWPVGGEIDMVEQAGFYDGQVNEMTLHTSPGCTLTTPMQATGNVKRTQCDSNVNGCMVEDTSTNSWGPGLGSSGGSVWATLYDITGVSIWRFARNAIPADITSKNPNPSGWGQPMGRWDACKCCFSSILI